MLPFEPEPEGVLKARYPEAIKKVIDLDEVEVNPEERPGLKREHVFDFYSGLRLIISRDKMGANVVLHVSASMQEEGGFACLKEFVDFVVENVTELRGEPVIGSVSIMITEKGIVHLTIPEKSFNPKWN